MIRLRCMHCGKSVSTAVPDDTMVRAALECPECLEPRLDREEARGRRQVLYLFVAALCGLVLGFWWRAQL